MRIKLILAFLISLSFTSCTENYSNGERIGLITQFSRTGNFWKSWEGHLNMTQTGMNSSTPFDFSIDNDNEPEGLVKTLDSAAQFGWKVKIVYHETRGMNWFKNRGMTDHFVTKCEVLDKSPLQTAFGSGSSTSGKIVDTIYLVIDKSQLQKQ
jgi:hypothetical protein